MIIIIIGLFNVQFSVILWGVGLTIQYSIYVRIGFINIRKLLFDSNNKLFTISGQLQWNQKTIKIVLSILNRLTFSNIICVFVYYLWFGCVALLFELRKNEKKGVKCMRLFVIWSWRSFVVAAEWKVNENSSRRAQSEYILLFRKFSELRASPKRCIFEYDVHFS